MFLFPLCGRLGHCESSPPFMWSTNSAGKASCSREDIAHSLFTRGWAQASICKWAACQSSSHPWTLPGGQVMATSPSQDAHIPPQWVLSWLLSPGAPADCFSHEAAADPGDLICPTKHKCLQQGGLCQQAQHSSREKAAISEQPPASRCKTALPPITSC